MSRKPTRHKCRCCNKFFFPDYRNIERQKFCSEPGCQQASKQSSQRRWCRKKDNRDYFRGEAAVRRVQQWRKAHPGYWRKNKPASKRTQAADPQSAQPQQASCNVPNRDLRALQDLCLTEHPAFVGLISMVTGSTLQDDIAATSRNLLLRGQTILGRKIPQSAAYDPQTFDPARSSSASSAKL